MAENEMKKLRDEVALRVAVLYLERTLERPNEFPPAVICESSFKFAEAFLAARYDADKAGSRSNG